MAVAVVTHFVTCPNLLLFFPIPALPLWSPIKQDFYLILEQGLQSLTAGRFLIDLNNYLFDIYEQFHDRSLFFRVLVYVSVVDFVYFLVFQDQKCLLCLSVLRSCVHYSPVCVLFCSCLPTVTCLWLSSCQVNMIMSIGAVLVRFVLGSIPQLFGCHLVPSHALVVFS